jgi:dolichol-phosphate mannosyltransferase
MSIAKTGSNLSIVVPFYNEEESLSHVVDELLEILPGAELILVDDGSSDETWKQILAYGASVKGVQLLQNCGQSGALFAGLRYVTRPLCGMMDGDGQNDPRDFLPLIEKLEQGAGDLICGVRSNRKDTLNRRIASRIANRIRSRLLGDSSTDTGCSLKVFRSKHAHLILPFNGLHRFLPTLFERAGYRMHEIPVNHRPRERGISKYSIGGRAIRGIYDLVGVAWLMKRRVIVPEVEVSWTP